MSLKRSGAYRQAWLATLSALLFFSYEGVVVGHLVALGNWSALLGPNAFLIAISLIFGFVGLIGNMLAFFMPIALFANARALRHVRANIERAAPLATFQPDLSLAIRDGETLTIAHRRAARGNAARNVVTWTFVLPFLALSGETLIVPLVPAALNYVQNLASAITSSVPLPTPNLSTWDWLAVAFPAVVTLALALLLAVAGRNDRGSQIVADDRGVTRRNSRQRTRFIPWSDIRVFLRGADSPIDSADGGYMLWGREHFFQFAIISLSSVRRLQEMATQNARSAPEPPYIFDGGYEQYLSDARRLLATIRARSGEPLRARAGATRWLNWGKRRFPTVAVELEDALAAPIAASPWQPTSEAIAAVPPRGSLAALVVLKPRLSVARVAGGTIAWLVPSALFVGICGSLSVLPLFIASSGGPDSLFGGLSNQVTTIVGIGIFAVVAVAVSFVLAAMWQRRRLPILVTDDLGVTRSGRREIAKTIPWTGIRAWAILPPQPGDRDGPTYFLFTEGDHFTWREPTDAQLAGRGIQGDRHLAYRERTAALHALIAARTALPLRELGLPKSANTLTA